MKGFLKTSASKLSLTRRAGRKTAQNREKDGVTVKEPQPFGAAEARRRKVGQWQIRAGKKQVQMARDLTNL